MTTVWVLVHEHKHGTDLSVHRTPQGAGASAMHIVVRSLAEIDDAALRARLGDLIARGDFVEAIRLWQVEIGTPEGHALRVVETELME